MTDRPVTLVKALWTDWGCRQGVVDGEGEFAPCWKPAVALMLPWDGDGPAYPVCAGCLQPRYLQPITEWSTND